MKRCRIWMLVLWAGTRRFPYGSEAAQRQIVLQEGYLVIPTQNGLDPCPIIVSPDGEPLSLRVFVDKSVREVFVNAKQCLAARVYPGREDSVGLSLQSQGRDAMLRSMDAWQMRSIYA
jgi:sucrose-6-phosphate hydrolase SacC (GH32 family)